MPLVLTIVNAADMPPSAEVGQKAFSAQGGTIGRSQDDDWVLPDPQRYVSARHAVIAFENGAYYLVDTSTNGVFLNDDESAVGRDCRVKLNNQDRVYIGEYEILVTLEAEAMSQAIDHNSPTGEVDMGTIPNDLDPLDLFGSDDAVPVKNTTPTETADFFNADVMDHTASLDEHFIPPGIETENPLPDDWAVTQMPKHHTPPPVDSAVESQIPADWDQTSLVKKAPPAPAPVLKKPIARQQRLSEAPVRPSPPVAERPRPGGATTSKKRQTPQSNQAVAQQPSPPSKEYEKLLQTIGIDRAAIPPELAKALPEIIGLMVRECVSGLIEVLMARTSMKSAFRVDQTMIRPVENNPLKFSVGVDEAIENMLLKNGRGYLPALDALREGFDDIKAHQMATMAGMQGALQDVLQRFDPEILEQRFVVGPKGNILLSAYNKTKYWDHYKALYEEIAKEAMDNFQNLLGEGFMRAYEEQVRRMEHAERGSKKRESK